jgi:hypothetical protein
MIAAHHANDADLLEQLHGLKRRKDLFVGQIPGHAEYDQGI